MDSLPLAPIRILLVEDDEVYRRALLKLSMEAAFAVREAGSAEAALALLVTEPAEVVLLDIDLPGLSGLEACGFIKQACSPPPFVILHSGRFTDSESRILGLDLGADDFLMKGTNLKELSARLRSIHRRLLTERKLQMKLWDSEHRFGALFDQAAVGLCFSHLDGTCADVNPEFCRLLGYERNELLGMHFRDFTHPADLHEDVDQAIAVLNGDAISYQIEKRYIRKNGSLFWVHLTVSLLRDHQGKPRRFVGVIQDIQEKKKALTDLRHLNESLEWHVRERTRELEETVVALRDAEIVLKDNEAKFRNILDHTSDWEYFLGSDGKLVYMSPSCESITGFPPEAFQDNPELFHRIVHETDQLLYQNHWKIRHQDASSPQVTSTQELDFRILARDGRIRWISHVCRPIHDPEGIYLGLRVSNRDITARKELEESLKLRDTQLHEVQKVAHLGYWKLHHPSQTLEWSQEVFRIFELSPEEETPTYESFLRRVHPDDRSLLDKSFRQSIDTGQTYDLVHRLLLAHGQLKFVHERGQTSYDPTGKPLVSLGSIQDITERENLAESLRRSEANLKEAQSLARLGHMEMDHVSGRRFWSEEIYRILELDPSTPPSFPAYQDLVHPEDRGLLVSTFQHSLASRSSYQFTHRLRFPDGRIKFIQARGYSFFDANGTPLHTLGTIQDVTEQELLSESLRASESRLRALMDAVPDLIFHLDHEGRILDVKATPDQLATPPGTVLIGHLLSDFLPPDLVERTIRLTSIALRNQTLETFEYELEFQTEGLRAYEARLVPASPTSVVIFIRDITERKRVLQLLTESEARFRTLAQSAPMMVWTANAELQLDFVNQSGLEFAGWAGQEEVQRQDWKNLVHPDDLPQAEASVNSAFKLGQLSTSEFRLRRKDGQYRWVIVTLQPRRDLQNRLVGTVGSAVDITERKQQEALGREVDALAARGKIAAYVAHEINNPLAGIKNAFRLIRGAVPAEHPHFHYVDLIHRELDRIAGIVRTIYSLYRPNPSLRRQASMEGILNDLVSLQQSMARDKGISLNLQPPSSELHGLIYEDLLRQVLFNLVQNAIDATPNGGLIELGAHLEDRQLKVWVRDQGPGVSPDVAQRIFEPGFTTKKALETSGLGLGLPNCQTLLSAVKGHIGFENRNPGPGSEFFVLLPWG